MSWKACQRDIADALRMAAKHQIHVENLSKSAGTWAIFHEYRNLVSLNTEVLELVHRLCSATFEDRHWEKLDHLCETGPKSIASSCFEQDKTIPRCTPADVWAVIARESTSASGTSDRTEFEDLIGLAMREGKLRNAFEAIKEQWSAAKIELVAYKTKGTIFLESSSAADVMDGLEDAIMTLGSMASNRASQHFREEIKEFLKLLSNIEESMQLWLATQSVWSYMESVRFLDGDTEMVCFYRQQAGFE